MNIQEFQTCLKENNFKFKCEESFNGMIKIISDHDTWFVDQLDNGKYRLLHLNEKYNSNMHFQTFCNTPIHVFRYIEGHDRKFSHSNPHMNYIVKLCNSISR